MNDWVDRYGNEPRKGADILVQALEREGVNQVRRLGRRCRPHEEQPGRVQCSS